MESGDAGRVKHSNGTCDVINKSTPRVECARIERQFCACSASATAIAGATCPPLPPPAIKMLDMYDCLFLRLMDRSFPSLYRFFGLLH